MRYKEQMDLTILHQEVVTKSIRQQLEQDTQNELDKEDIMFLFEDHIRPIIDKLIKKTSNKGENEFSISLNRLNIKIWSSIKKTQICGYLTIFCCFTCWICNCYLGKYRYIKNNDALASVICEKYEIFKVSISPKKQINDDLYLHFCWNQ